MLGPKVKQDKHKHSQMFGILICRHSRRRMNIDCLSLSAMPTAVRMAALGKRHARDVARFLLDIDVHIDQLRRTLEDQSYRPGKGRAFHVFDPKSRRIYALPFRDRVAQHLLIDLVARKVDASLRPQTFACRNEMGTHRCLHRATQLVRAGSYVLRVDIAKFFSSIDHEILRVMLNRTTPLAWRWLRDRFLDAPFDGERVHFHFPGDDLFSPVLRPHGLPIGSLTSQIWANVYLGVMDDLIASHLGIGTFVRYSDDILIFHNDPGRLRAALLAIEDRATKLRLRLHPRKTGIHRTTEPLPFLGFVLRRRGDGVEIRLRRDNVDRMRQKMQWMAAMFHAGAFGVDEVKSRLVAWLAHARHGHTQALVRHELEHFVLRCRND